ncbi:hypothetical protein D3C87_459800 [compost metagenome]
MINTASEVNTSLTLTVKGPGAGLPSPADLVLLKNGAVDTATAITFASVGIQDLYNFTFVPASTGTYTLHAFGDIQARVEVVTKSVYNSLRDILDESIGSWQWDKTTGGLVMLRQDGATLATFTVVDNLTTSSRERIS